MKFLIYAFIMINMAGIGQCGEEIVQSSQSRLSSSKNISTSAYQAKNFSYLLGKMAGFPDALLKLHFQLYEGYVKNINELLEGLKSMSTQNQDRTIAFGALKRRVGWEYDGMVLHEYYFENLGGQKELDRRSSLAQKIAEDFGSLSSWEKDFIATGLIRGIGWVVLYREPKEGRLINTWINEHDVGHLAGGTPILVMDVWEHAYITEYGLDRAGYINAFMRNINWDIVEQRYSHFLKKFNE